MPHAVVVMHPWPRPAPSRCELEPSVGASAAETTVLFDIVLALVLALVLAAPIQTTPAAASTATPRTVLLITTTPL
ncbi:hypothetical protein AB4039_35245 [Streptomyces sp. M-16]|uniref:hypothetical protein n=1 Tax=Streptomyces sp. M-16 TaxID=3233040 RepID=UPI00225A15FE